ncbi:unnamed protein product [Urochloa humidicola]
MSGEVQRGEQAAARETNEEEIRVGNQVELTYKHKEARSLSFEFDHGRAGEPGRSPGPGRALSWRRAQVSFHHGGSAWRQAPASSELRPRQIGAAVGPGELCPRQIGDGRGASLRCGQEVLAPAWSQQWRGDGVPGRLLVDWVLMLQLPVCVWCAWMVFI